ncbi:MAG: hypothetical protein NTV63_02700 [Candidatus Woesearchaeota archaeon]|nr:hypothetical protein [Candidatus Woesearchaeota archaeon]
MRRINKKGNDTWSTIGGVVIVVALILVSIVMINNYVVKKGGTAAGSSMDKASIGLTGVWDKLFGVQTAKAAENMPGEKSAFEFGSEQKVEIPGPETYFLTISEPNDNDAITVTVKDKDKKEVLGCAETSEWKFSAGKNDCCMNENSGLCLKLIELLKDEKTDEYYGANLQVYSKSKYPLPNGVKLDTDSNKGTNSVSFWFGRSKYSITLTKVFRAGLEEGAHLRVNKISSAGENIVCELKIRENGGSAKCGSEGFEVIVSKYALYHIGSATGWAQISVLKV